MNILLSIDYVIMFGDTYWTFVWIRRRQKIGTYLIKTFRDKFSPEKGTNSNDNENKEDEIRIIENPVKM